MKLLLTRLLILYMCAMPLLLLSQISDYEHIGLKDGLPSSFVYRVYEDSKGYIWFATEKGAVRYDGYEMEVFDSSDGLPADDVYKIQEDLIGRIWIFTASSKYSFILEDSIYVVPEVSFRTPNIWYMNNENVFLLSDGHYSKISNNNMVCQSRYLRKEDSVMFFESNLNDSTSVFTYNKTIAVGKPNLPLYEVIKLDRFSSYEVLTNTLSTCWQDLLISPTNDKHNKPGIRLVSPKGIRAIELDGVEKDALIIATYNTFNNTVQISSNNSLIMYDENFEIINNYNFDLTGFDTYNSTYMDSNKNFWVATNNGVYKKRNNILEIGINSISNVKEKINLLKAYDNKIYYSNGKGQIKVFSDKIEYVLKTVKTRPDRIYKFDFFDDNLILSNRSSCITIIKNENIKFNKLKKKQVPQREFKCTCKEFELVDDNVFCIGDKTMILSLSDNTNTGLSDKKSLSLGMNTANNKILYSTEDSVLLIQHIDNDLPKRIISHPVQNIRYIEYIDNETFLCSDKTSKSYFYTQDKGLKNVAWLSPKESIVKVISDNDSLIILTNKSIYFSDTRSFLAHSSPTRFVYLNDLDNSFLVNDIAYLDRKLYLGSSEGLKSVDFNYQSVNSDNVTYYVRKINNENYDDRSVYEYDYDNNNISVDFDMLTYSNREDISMNYHLTGPENIADSTYSRSIRFDRLPPGKYDLELTPKKYGETVGSTKNISFHIDKPYYQKGWFLLLLSLSMLSLFGYVIYFLTKRERRKSAINQKYAELELNALQSQMNPHFVFNAMNSIQNLISTERIEEADKYLSKFARLMRQFLEVSREKFIPLYEEIEIVEKYLELEILRFGDDLTYVINNYLTEDELDVEVPATLIQPFVENAVIHGLFHKKNKGHISITLRNENNFCIIEIEDDGIGRVASEIINSKRNVNHISRGKEIVDEKLAILNQMNQFNIEYEIIDLYDEQEATGTRVIIRLKMETDA